MAIIHHTCQQVLATVMFTTWQCIGIPIPDPFSQSQDSGIQDPGIGIPNDHLSGYLLPTVSQYPNTSAEITDDLPDVSKHYTAPNSVISTIIAYLSQMGNCPTSEDH